MTELIEKSDVDGKTLLDIWAKVTIDTVYELLINRGRLHRFNGKGKAHA